MSEGDNIGIWTVVVLGMIVNIVYGGAESKDKIFGQPFWSTGRQLWGLRLSSMCLAKLGIGKALVMVCGIHRMCR